jgi:hypothetical protein
VRERERERERGSEERERYARHCIDPHPPPLCVVLQSPARERERRGGGDKIWMSFFWKIKSKILTIEFTTTVKKRERERERKREMCSPLQTSLTPLPCVWNCSRRHEREREDEEEIKFWMLFFWGIKFTILIIEFIVTFWHLLVAF